MTLVQVDADLPRWLPARPRSVPGRLVGAGQSFGVTLVRDGADLSRGGAPFDAVAAATDLAAMAARGHCVHEGRVFPFNFSSFLIEELVLDERGFPAPTDYKIFVAGGRILWIQLHFRQDGHGWVAFLDETFRLLPEPAWDPGTCWRTHRALVCTDPAMVEDRRPACLSELLDGARRLGDRLRVFTRLDWYADAARGPLLGEITPFPHMLQPRGFYSDWANRIVADAWDDPDGVAPHPWTPDSEDAAFLPRVEARLADDAKPDATLPDLMPPPSDAPWAADEGLSRGDLRRLVEAFDLTPWGVKPGGCVALMIENGSAAAALLTATMARYVAVPLDPALPPARLAEQLTEVAAQAVLAVEHSRQAAAMREAARLNAGPLLIELGADEALPRLPQPPVRQSLPAPPYRRLDDDAMLLRTSGTTGEPKIVGFSLRRLANAGAMIARSLNLSAADAGVSMLPLHHVGGIACNLMAPLMVGAPMRFRRAFDPKDFFDALAGPRGAAWAYLVPSMWEMAIDYAEARFEPEETSRWPRLRVARSAGAELPAPLASRMAKAMGPRVAILPTYGMTEAMPVASPTAAPGHRPVASGDVGRALPGVKVEIIDPGAPNAPPLPDGAVGEIAVKGPGALSAGDPAAEAAGASFTARGFLRTGDLGRLASDGSGALRVEGRLKDVVNRGGETLPPAEIEAGLAGYPDLPSGARLMVFARNHEDLGEDVALAIAPLHGDVDLDALNAWAATRLPDSMLPRTLARVPDLPRSSGGKLLRARFAARFNSAVAPAALGRCETYIFETEDADPRRLAGQENPPSAGGPDDAAALDRIVEIAADFVGRAERVGPDSRLADLGVNSLASVELSARLNQVFGAELPPWAIVDHPTPRALHAHLFDRGPAPAAPAIQTTDRRRSAQQPLRLLFLHGEASDAELMRVSLQATHWIARLDGLVEITALDAPHTCAPKPHFHAAAVQAGLYANAEYRTWGATDAAMLGRSLAAVEDVLDAQGPFDGIGGICDGALLATMAAARRDDLRLLLNLSPSPMSRLAPERAAESWAVACRSIHLLSPRDEMHSIAEQQELVARCRNALVLQHDRGHAVPTLEGDLARDIAAALTDVAGAAPRAATPHRSPTGSDKVAARPSSTPKTTLARWEDALNDHPAVEQAVVVEASTPGDATAFLILAQDVERAPPNLRAHLAERVPDAPAPGRLVPLASLPRTESGAVDRAALRALKPSATAERSAPETALEAELAEIWRDVLLLESSPGVDDDFFDLGGYSLLTVILLKELGNRLDRNVPHDALLDLTTIRRLAAKLEAASPRPAARPAAPEDALDPAIETALLTHTASWKGERVHARSLVFGANTSSATPPLFWCCQGHHEFSQLAAHLGSDQPLFGMRSGHLVMDRTPGNVERLGRRYAEEIMALRPEGPLMIGGNCQAAKIAFHIARHAIEEGRDVSLLCLQEQVVPLSYDGRVALIFGESSDQNPERWYPSIEPSWRPFYTGPVSVRMTSGRHGQFFDPPHVVTLAAALRAELSGALAAGPGGLSSPPRRPGLSAAARKAVLRVSGPKRVFETAGRPTTRIEMIVENASREEWRPSSANPLQIGAWVHARGVKPPVFYAVGDTLDAPLPPGARTTLSLDLPIPSRPGAYPVRLDLLDNGAAWFAFGGSAVATLTLDTRFGGAVTGWLQRRIPGRPPSAD